ncbi:MAG: peptidylprolyl isomerase [Cyanobacteriota bacterium]|nr:peptidylprolyl isomerase [Cyanobacteriota bacterium]
MPASQEPFSLEPIPGEDVTLSTALPLSAGFGTAIAGSHLPPPPAPEPPAPSPGPTAPLSEGDLVRHLSDPLWQLLARHQLLVPLLRQAVIAEAVAGVILSEEERQQAQKNWLQQQGIQSPEQLLQHLTAHGMSEADALWQAELPVRIRHHCQEQFLHRAEQRFLGRKQQLDTVIYSLLRVSSGALANELYLRIAEGEADFAELAATYAEGPEQATRGVVGPVPLLQAHPTLANLLRTSQPGELRPPLAIEPWWLVVRLESLQPASFDEAMQSRMTHELFEEWVEEEVRQRITSHQPGARL